MKIKDRFSAFLNELQNHICATLEKEDGQAKFIQDEWKRPGGGGGKTRVIRNGKVFEKGGVNVSNVFGTLPEQMQHQLNVDSNEFFACGLSLVIHPDSPMVPTIHANFRYFEMYNDNGDRTDGWFGGGIDMTPYYLWEDDAVYFHQTLKKVCDQHGKDLYPKFKKDCDAYFYNSHRNEARGIGGIFFDYLKADQIRSLEDWMKFVMDTANTFIACYLPVVSKRKSELYDAHHKEWQEIRRGRYVEFNLIHDKGTLFGLKTNGRIESILMSLPAKVRWEYNHEPEKGSRESKLLESLKPRDWAAAEKVFE